MAKTSSDKLIEQFRVNLKRFRETAGLSQSELARRISATPGYVCDLERGRRAPNLATLAPLAEALGITPSVLLETESGKSSK